VIFADPRRPRAIELPPGRRSQLRRDMDSQRVIAELLTR
jgi:hypothetical protein